MIIDIPRRSSRTGLLVVAVSAIAISLFSLALYGSASLDSLSEEGEGLASTYAPASLAIRVALYVHIVTASIALAIGPLQFVRRVRNRFPAFHRAIGRTYLVTVGLAAISALMIAPLGFSGMVGFFGFSTLAVLWAWSGWRALRAIRIGDIRSHQAWMIRNYALTFAAPMLRIWVAVLIAVQMIAGGPDTDQTAAFANAYNAVPFLCWLPNVVVAEWLIRRRGLPSYRLTP